MSTGTFRFVPSAIDASPNRPCIFSRFPPQLSGLPPDPVPPLRLQTQMLGHLVVCQSKAELAALRWPGLGAWRFGLAARGRPASPGDRAPVLGDGYPPAPGGAFGARS